MSTNMTLYYQVFLPVMAHTWDMPKHIDFQESGQNTEDNRMGMKDGESTPEEPFPNWPYLY